MSREDKDSKPAARNVPRSGSGRIRRWLRDPLAHFLLIGAALFALYSVVAPPRAADLGSRIELTEDDLRQIQLGWGAKWRRAPTPAEWNGLIEGQVREEILYREALAMGLDQDDAIVRRRLGQKLEFLMEDVSSLRDPTTEELKDWYRRNSAQFALPPRVTFCHAYFSPDSKQGAPAARARQALQILGPRPDCAATASVGDRFPDYDYYADRDPDEIANVFGTQFSRALFRLQPGAWRGPVESGLGWHLVLVEALAPGRVPPFEDVNRQEVESAWLDSRRAEARRKAYAAMRAKYEVVLPQSAGQ